MKRTKWVAIAVGKQGLDDLAAFPVGLDGILNSNLPRGAPSFRARAGQEQITIVWAASGAVAYAEGTFTLKWNSF